MAADPPGLSTTLGVDAPIRGLNRRSVDNFFVWSIVVREELANDREALSRALTRERD
jgi:hypothetical protein